MDDKNRLCHGDRFRSSVPSFVRALTISIVSIFSSSYLHGPGFVIVAIAAAVLSAFG